MKMLSVWAIVLTLVLFSGSAYLGYISSGSSAARALTDNLRGSLSPLRDLGSLTLMLVIFANNSLKALAVIMLGVIPFLLPAGFVVLNGFILGVVVNEALATRGIGFTLLGLAPHGVLELAAVLTAVALGFQVGFVVLGSSGSKKGRLGQQYRYSLALYLKFILPALFLAAIIETLVGRYVLPRVQ